MAVGAAVPLPITSGAFYKSFETVNMRALKDSMQQHLFRIGQSIEFKYSLRTRSAAPGQYRIVGFRPSEGDEPCYRIKSDLERYERIVREDEVKQIS